MKRPGFLSNKVITCDFCMEEFYGNINTENIVMCWKCVNRLLRWSDVKKLKFLDKFKRDKGKEKIIMGFISEEALNGGETEKHTEYINREYDNKELSFAKLQDWQKQGSFVLDNEWVEVS